MKRFKSLLTVLLAVCLLFTSTISVLAGTDELYLSDLRIIYADDYDEACEILSQCNLEGFEVLDENLNDETGEKGTWLAYQTTEDIEEAITDIAIMQMDGGYDLGNYQEMIKESLDEYEKMGAIYLEAIDYFIEAYEADHFLTQSAYRQLNFFSGLDNFEDEKFGDVVLSGELTEKNLANLFLEGNSYALSNIRSLLAMGVSYNEDGETYLEKVATAVKEMEGTTPDIDEETEKVAILIEGTIPTFRNMFKELETVEAELNYEDDNVTDDEIAYAEYLAVAGMLRDVEYLNGKTLYEFFMEYEIEEDEDEKDYEALYPLIAALNEGQLAMTNVAHYYDVVRYSMSELTEEVILDALEESEEKYGESPFDLYTGVDRTIFDGSFAVTSEASRADAYTESGLASALFGNGNAWNTALRITGFVAGAGLFGYAIARTVNKTGQGLNLDYDTIAREMADTLKQKSADYVTNIGQQTPASFLENEIMLSTSEEYIAQTSSQYANIESMFDAWIQKYNLYNDNMANWTFAQKFQYLNTKTTYLTGQEYKLMHDINVTHQLHAPDVRTAAIKAEQAARQSAMSSAKFATGALYIVGSLLMLYSASRIIYDVICYYNPEYSDIPVALVDLINTPDGDRYIKYDAVLEAESRSKGVYVPGDLNAFEAQRWNAVYFTKSYEAGKPLLADEFEISHTNNIPDEGYAAVHGFGQEICYDLNRYNFDDDYSIYLSIKQSENNKSAVADVPDIIGSIFGTGYLALSLGVGAAAGVGGTLGTQKLLKKKTETAQEENQA